MQEGRKEGDPDPEILPRAKDLFKDMLLKESQVVEDRKEQQAFKR